MGQHLGKRDPHQESKDPSPEAEPEAVSEQQITAEPEPQDEVFGLAEADVNPNNGCSSETATADESPGGAEGPGEVWTDASAADPDAAAPRPHLVRLFSRDAPGREDNTFKDRPSESDELQTIQEHSGAGSECGSDSPEQDLD